MHARPALYIPSPGIFIEKGQKDREVPARSHEKNETGQSVPPLAKEQEAPPKAGRSKDLQGKWALPRS